MLPFLNLSSDKLLSNFVALGWLLNVCLVYRRLLNNIALCSLFSGLVALGKLPSSVRVLVCLFVLSKLSGVRLVVGRFIAILALAAFLVDVFALELPLEALCTH